MHEINITICTTKIGEKWIAVTSLGGITVKGGRAADEADAVRSLMGGLAQQSNEDYAIAIELAVQEQTLEDVFHTGPTMLPKGDEK